MTGAEKLIAKERARRSAHYFIFESGFLKTKDEHDQENPVKTFPDQAYLRVLLDCLLVSGRYTKPDAALFALSAGVPLDWLERIADIGLLPVEKSRQVMATWLVCAYLLWRAKYKPYQLILVQSKREDDAANLVFNKEPEVGRVSFMEHNLPSFLKSVEFPKAGTYAHLFFPNGSHIWAIPEGADIIRSNTPSVCFSDEAAFQPEFDASYTAARPCLDGGGQYIAISSANPGSFCDLVEGIAAPA